MGLQHEQEAQVPYRQEPPLEKHSKAVEWTVEESMLLAQLLVQLLKSKGLKTNIVKTEDIVEMTRSLNMYLNINKFTPAQVKTRRHLFNKLLTPYSILVEADGVTQSGDKAFVNWDSSREPFSGLAARLKGDAFSRLLKRKNNKDLDLLYRSKCFETAPIEAARASSLSKQAYKKTTASVSVGSSCPKAHSDNALSSLKRKIGLNGHEVGLTGISEAPGKKPCYEPGEEGNASDNTRLCTYVSEAESLKEDLPEGFTQSTMRTDPDILSFPHNTSSTAIPEGYSTNVEEGDSAILEQVNQLIDKLMDYVKAKQLEKEQERNNRLAMEFRKMLSLCEDNGYLTTLKVAEIIGKLKTDTAMVQVYSQLTGLSPAVFAHMILTSSLVD